MLPEFEPIFADRTPPTARRCHQRAGGQRWLAASIAIRQPYVLPTAAMPDPYPRPRLSYAAIRAFRARKLVDNFL